MHSYSLGRSLMAALLFSISSVALASQGIASQIITCPTSLPAGDLNQGVTFESPAGFQWEAMDSGSSDDQSAMVGISPDGVGVSCSGFLKNPVTQNYVVVQHNATWGDIGGRVVISGSNWNGNATEGYYCLDGAHCHFQTVS